MARAGVLAGCAAAFISATAAIDPEERIVAAFKDKPSFLWGTATAAYQVEGAYKEGGRQESIWDVFAHEKGVGHVWGDETGDRADEFYHRWREDIERLDEYGFNSFRLSIAWTRIFPLVDGVHRPNPEGVKFYKEVITRLIAKGLTPSVTIYHWDLPTDYDWLDESVVPAFVQYAEFLFMTFPEVKHWITFNEPFTFCLVGYRDGVHAPGIKSEYKHYQCGHNVLRAHAKAVELYRNKYQQDDAQLGITLNYEWSYPWNASNPDDHAAAQVDRDFAIGWWADPIFLTGDYPPSMRAKLGDNLPNFTAEESARLKNSADFYGINIYGGGYVKSKPDGTYENTYIGMDGQPIGVQADSPWLYVVPNSMRKYLEYVHERYTGIGIYVTENGCDVPGEMGASLEDALNDTFRVNYYRYYLDEAAKAVMENNVNLKGYYAWSLLDNFEWADGYKFRFGLTYVNYTTQKRYLKNSARWFRRLMEKLTPDKFIFNKPEEIIV